MFFSENQEIDVFNATTPKKSKCSLNSPVKTFKNKQMRESSLSPRRSVKDSPSKYNKLNVKIVKTPEKSNKPFDCPTNTAVNMERSPPATNGNDQKEVDGCSAAGCKTTENNYKRSNTNGGTPTIIAETVVRTKPPEQSNTIDSKKVDSIKYSVLKDDFRSNRVNRSDDHYRPVVISPCQSSELLEEFEKFISGCTEVAVALDISTVGADMNKIGRKIRKQIIGESDTNKKRFTHNDRSVDGLAIYSGLNIYFIDLLCQCKYYFFSCLTIQLYCLIINNNNVINNNNF